ncbi:hypothetical protein GOL22_27115 [Sinorhizobium medicae]|nr:hypothetical protein [Sinorhizobium medicae]
MDFYESAVGFVKEGFREVFCPTLPSREREICDTVRIRVIRSWGFLAQASNRGIEISAGVGWIFDTIDWARLLSNEATGSDDCFNEYMSYVYEGITKNTQRVRANLPARPVMGIDKFAFERSSCHGIDERTISEISTREAEVHARGVESSLAFILLHELGHVVLGHTRIDPESLSLAEKREIEAEADTWAIKAANKSSYNIAGSMAPYFIGSIQQSTIDWEQNSDHPMGIRRLENFYRLVLVDLESNPERRQQLGDDYDEVVQDVRKHTAIARDCLKAIESGSSCQ